MIPKRLIILGLAFVLCTGTLSFPALAEETTTPGAIVTPGGVDFPQPPGPAQPEIGEPTPSPSDVVDIVEYEEIPLRDGEGTIIRIGSTDVTLVARLNDTLPKHWRRQLRYTKYPVAVNYVYITASSVSGRTLPSSKAKALKTFKSKERIAVTAIVKSSSGDGKEWYMLEYYSNNKAIQAFIPISTASLRGFQLGRAAKMIEALEAFTSKGQTAFVHNYKNRAGAPPTLSGKTIDALGNRRDQSAPLYDAPSGILKRYLEDGSIVNVVEESESWSRIALVDTVDEYWTPTRYLSRNNAVSALSQAIVVDRRSQNIAVFEKDSNGWTLISLSLATTGGNDKYRMPTPLGFFQAIEKRSRFQFLGDISKKIEGYAPYATRFSGGAYIHGVPVSYVTKTIEPAIGVGAGSDASTTAPAPPPITKQIDPGMREYLSSIGTVPLSHKCVRNYTSHAKFIYDWVRIGQSAVLVIE
jgi:lipoprotein-anchoring transpeptidase ErfK/SrfK